MTTLPTHTPDGETIFSVSELNQASRDLLEAHHGTLLVGGEISNYSKASSGHIYFTLKDTRAKIRCAFFRGKHSPGLTLSDGMQVIVKARVSLYVEGGDYQLLVESALDAGRGLLMQRFEALKKELAAKGLFDAAHKRPLPAFPQTLGIITSPTSAVLHDITQILARRFPALAIVVYASPVQGEAAVPQLIAAIQKANQERLCDVLILARGGGSLEDLWAFNHPQLAYVIHDSRLPIVSAVGHETDFTIADWVADVRAPTPSAAAELVSPDQQELRLRLGHLQQRLTTLVARQLLNTQQHLRHLHKRLRHPHQILQAHTQRLDTLQLALQQALQRRLAHYRYRLEMLRQQITPRWMIDPLRDHQQHTDLLRARLQQAWQQQLAHKRKALAAKVHTLEALSPLATLARGYAIVQTADQHTVISSQQLAVNDQLLITLAEGRVLCSVMDSRPS